MGPRFWVGMPPPPPNYKVLDPKVSVPIPIPAIAPRIGHHLPVRVGSPRGGSTSLTLQGGRMTTYADTAVGQAALGASALSARTPPQE